MKIEKIVKDILQKNGSIKNMYFIGCGASKGDLYPGYYFILHNSNIKCGHLTANEFNYDTPIDIGKNSVVVTASLSGTTPESVEATKIAKKLGATVIAFSKDIDSELMQPADYKIVHSLDDSPIGKLEKQILNLRLAVEIVQQVDGYEYYEKMMDGFDKLPDLIGMAVKASKLPAVQFAEKYKDDSMIYALGSGPTFDVVYETTLCSLLEGQWINSACIHSGEFFHGALEITDKNVPFILFMSDGSTRHLDARVLDFLYRFGAKVTVIDGKDFGISNTVDPNVAEYFNPAVLNAACRVYIQELADARGHALSTRRYMWKLEY